MITAKPTQREPRPRILMLCCGAGGDAMGYYRVGFDPVGVDKEHQAHFPFRFYQQDITPWFGAEPWMCAVGEFALSDFDAIHASPPCQRWSIANRNNGTWQNYPDLITPLRPLLEATGLPWVIENVPGAPLRADFKLCGCVVGLEVRRVRHFETSWHALDMRPPCQHYGPVVSVVGHGTPSWVREKLGRNPTITEYRDAMGIDWMNRDELSQAIPPRYTQVVGLSLLEHLRMRVTP